MNTIRFDDQVAVITGAGSGLGRSHALELARRGARVVVNDLGGAVDGTGQSHSAADRVVREIADADGTAVASHDSVATPEGGEAIIQVAKDAFGRIDIVINNAGILRDKSFAKLSPDDLRAVLAVHLEGAFYVTQPAFRLMREHGYGRILFTSSAAGLWGNFGQSNYGAAKMGLVGLANVLAQEGAKYGITSNVIAPAAGTRMTASVGNEKGPMDPYMTPDKVTALVCYLVSRECTVTQHIFSVGMGRFARIFLGLTPGWFAGKDADPSPEDVRDHFDQICEEQGYSVPAGVADEMVLMMRALGLA